MRGANASSDVQDAAAGGASIVHVVSCQCDCRDSVV